MREKSGRYLRKVLVCISGIYSNGYKHIFLIPCLKDFTVGKKSQYHDKL